MAFSVPWKVVIDTGKNRREMVLIAPNRDAAINAACKVAENMGGDYLDIVTCDLDQEYDHTTPTARHGAQR